jgi:uncharacterized phiE125 gp8 family phage protein
MTLKIVTEPIEEPSSLEEAKLQLRISTSPPTAHPDDALIAIMAKAARRWCEGFQGRAYVTQVWDLYLDRFPRGRALELPLPPLQYVESITYRDAAGTDTVVSLLDPSGEGLLETDDYLVDIASEPGRLILKDGRSWPSTGNDPHSVRIRFTAGYGDAEDVPDDFRIAILMRLSDMYENRGDSERAIVTDTKIDTVKLLLWPERVIHL